jgi:hypothetical protein
MISIIAASSVKPAATASCFVEYGSCRLGCNDPNTIGGAVCRAACSDAYTKCKAAEKGKAGSSGTNTTGNPPKKKGPVQTGNTLLGGANKASGGGNQ